MKIKQFGKFPKAKRFTPPVRHGGGARFEKQVEQPLTGEVNNLKAAKGEERFARMLRKSQAKGVIRGFTFRITPGVPRNVVGFKELDFWVDAGNRHVAISVKGEDFVHKTQAEKEKDKLSELIILTRLRRQGYDVPEITTVPAASLDSQEGAEKVGKDLGIFR